MPTTAVPKLMRDPGYLFWAPLGTAVASHTVAGSVFTDTWPVGFINLGATTDGSELKYEIETESIEAAEFLDPLVIAETGRSGSIAFALMDFTMNNLKRALNGGTIAVVSGTGATALNKYTPPTPGASVRCMIGWESLDATMRFIAYQTLQTNSIGASFKKAPSTAALACEFAFEVPTSGVPFEFWSAGTARLGA
mgnify:FL=1